MSRSIGYTILASLLDGQPHQVGEYLTYWKSRIDPSMAARKYTDAYKRNRRRRGQEPGNDLKPLDEKIETGSNRIILTTLGYYRRREWLTYHQPSPGRIDNITVQLTPLALHVLRLDRQKNSTFNRVWAELKLAFQKGFVDVTVSPGNPDYWRNQPLPQTTQEETHASSQEISPDDQRGNEAGSCEGGDDLPPGEVQVSPPLLGYHPGGTGK